MPFREGENIRAVIATRAFKEAEYLVFATKNGMVKTEVRGLQHPLKADGIIAINLRPKDELVGVIHSSGDDDILMVSRKAGDPPRVGHPPDGESDGWCARDEAAQGRRGDRDQPRRERRRPARLTDHGYGSGRGSTSTRSKRGGLGVKTVQLTETKGKLAAARGRAVGYQVMLISTGGTVIKMAVDDIKRLGRSTQA